MLAVDGAHVYWSEVRGFGFGAPSIARANLDGSGVDENFIIDSWGGCGLAVDGAHIYWSNTRGVGAGGRGSIARANLDGTGVDQNFIPVFTNEFFDYPCGVAVDREHVYWAWLNSALEGAGSIGRANLDGTAVDQDFIPYEGLRPSCGIALHGARIYWGGGSIARANLDGSERAEHHPTRLKHLQRRGRRTFLATTATTIAFKRVQLRKAEEEQAAAERRS